MQARTVRFILATIMWAAILITLFMLLTSPGWAHDSWINRGAYTDQNGIHCCGPNDCDLIHPSRVVSTPSGYLIDRTLHVPYSQAQPGEDGYYHRCHYPDNRTRCFFTPGGGV